MEVLTDQSIMERGKFAGQKLCNVPAWYLLWFKENVSPTFANQGLHNYINENIQVLQTEKLRK